jgi:mercury(II) reductase
MTAPGRAYDLAVIGAGSAGFSAAITAAEAGARVALIGHGEIGGTCVNVGCIPSKTLIRSVEPLYQARAAARFPGISAEARLADWGAVKQAKDELVATLRQAKYADILPHYDTIDYITGPARLAAGGVVVGSVVTGSAPLKAGKIIIATGSAPAVPRIEGLDDIAWLTSTTTFALDRLPRSVVVIGGGYIGCEITQMLARAGVATSLVCRSRLLPAGEPEISTALAGYLGGEGVRIIDGVSYKAVCKDGEDIALALERDGEPEEITAERLILATGRRPNADGLGLEAAGIARAPGGGIMVDDYMETSAPGIYAAGDVTGRDQFVYMAAYGAKIAAHNALGGNLRRYDNRAMPAVVFTDPQVASVGLTEARARTRGFDVKTSVLPLSHVPRALAARDVRGLIKLVANAADDRLLGAHILAPEGADSIQTAALAIQQGLTTRALADMIAPYLTTVEGLKLAAQTFDKDIAKLSCCAG